MENWRIEENYGKQFRFFQRLTDEQILSEQKEIVKNMKDPQIREIIADSLARQNRKIEIARATIYGIARRASEEPANEMTDFETPRRAIAE